MECEKIIEDYEKKLSRIEKILKHSDKQQLKLQQLQDKLQEKEAKIRALYQENINQQLFAKEKMEKIIHNDLEKNSKIVFEASDVLSGDFYSIFKIDNKIFIYLIDGQGHGVTPALTIYAVSSNLKNIIKNTSSFEKITEKLFNEVRKFLAEDEQLSYSFLCIENNTIQYSIGGMYPILIQTDKELIKIKANNHPFISISYTPKIDTIQVENIQRVILYSDGIREDSDLTLIRKFHPKNIIQNPKLIEELKLYMEGKKFNDDITVMLIDFTI